ncbi:MAG: helix-hairpin-helix domain-containing protein [Cetobacterium sp.]
MSYDFIVEGSLGDLYAVSFSIENNTLFSKCNCMAGLNGLFCKHRYQILSEDISHIRDLNIEILNDFYSELSNVKKGLDDFYNYKPRTYSKKISNHEKDKLVHFISPEGFNIKGFGKAHLKKVIENGLVTEPIDILKLYLKKDFIIENNIFTKSKIESIILSIEESKKIKYSDFLIALGIPYIGEVNAKIISKHTNNLYECFTISLDEIIENFNLGIDASKSFKDFFDLNKKYIQELLDQGIEIVYNINKQQNQTLKAKKIAFTGKLQRLERREVKNLVEELGGESVDSINSELNILVIGEKVGSKLEKAKKIPTILILTEEEFITKYCTDIYL